MTGFCRTTAAALVCLACLATLLVGCEDRQARENGKLAGEVLALHDEAMAKMTVMYELKLQLSETERRTGRTPETRAALEDLERARILMLEWMRHYRAPAPEDPPAQARAYLLEEREKIRQVGGVVDAGIARAQNISGSDPGR